MDCLTNKETNPKMMTKKNFRPPNSRKKIPNQSAKGVYWLWFLHWPENQVRFSAVSFHPVSPNNTLWLLTNDLTSAGQVGHW